MACGIFLAVGFIALISAILTIATSSIAIECYNICGLKETKYTNWVFVICNLVFGILLLLVSFPLLYSGISWEGCGHN
jgi:hypothetical protein